MKEALLYLCHRIPYPPNKGDKITTFNVLKFLAKHYDIYLGTFIDDKNDNQYRDHVAQYCKESFFVELNPTFAKIKGLTALVKNEAITLSFYRRKEMQQWVNTVITKNNIKKSFIYSGCMAQYVLTPSTAPLRKIMQFADIDSDKWRQFSAKQNSLMSKIYLREFKTLFEYEKHVAKHFALSCFISDSEVSLFKSMIEPSLHEKIKTLGNGIDSDFFSPTANARLNEPFNLANENYIVFTGAMDYQPNIDTVTWFVEKVWLEVVRHCPNAKFYIVGSSPTKKVLALTSHAGVIVTGRVEDIRPYLAHAKASVAPMQIARGIQNKILEAMAMELPVLTNALGAEGLEKHLSDNLFITESPDRMKDWIQERLKQPISYAKESRKWLEQHYSWHAKLVPLLEYLEEKRA